MSDNDRLIARLLGDPQKSEAMKWLMNAKAGEERTIGTRRTTGIVPAWPTTATGFVLESTTSLGPSAVWTPDSTPVDVRNGLNVVTISISGTSRFYRLTK